MEEFVEYLSLIPAGETFVTFSQSASIRRFLKECITQCIQSGRDSSTETSAVRLVKSKPFDVGCESPPSRVLSELSKGAVDAAIDAITLLLEHPERSH